MTETDNFWLSCEMGERALKYTVDMMGADRVIYASDFPHEPTEQALMHDIPNFLARNDLDEVAKGKILYHNSKRLYGIA